MNRFFFNYSYILHTINAVGNNNISAKELAAELGISEAVKSRVIKKAKYNYIKLLKGGKENRVSGFVLTK